ncbi:uncharacterized protein LOC117115081 [Anneissia japonica]|uniref:uncharacterized protein LOC117115081 n=1 Tax=Anneissia japonica TaxID=1529436 RepID=UPI0014255386|nr:uncharacterized protein LOC117115081 [Anneissia japonica]
MIPLVVFMTAIVVSSALPVMKQESDAGTSFYDNFSSAYWQKIVEQYAGLDPNEIAAKAMEEFSNNGLVPSAGQSFEDVDWQKYLEAGEEMNNGQDFNIMGADMIGQDITLNGMSQTISFVPDFNNMDMNELMNYLGMSSDAQLQ